MKLQTAVVLCLVPYVVNACQAEEMGCAAGGERRKFVLEIEAMHTLSGDELQQKIIVQEDSTFFVSTRVGPIRWTFSGDVGCVVKGHLPVMMKSQWYASADSNENSVSPKLLKVNDEVKRFSAAVHGHGMSVIAREPTKADQLPPSREMDQAMRRMIRDLQQEAEPEND